MSLRNKKSYVEYTYSTEDIRLHKGNGTYQINGSEICPAILSDCAGASFHNCNPLTYERLRKSAISNCLSKAAKMIPFFIFLIFLFIMYVIYFSLPKDASSHSSRSYTTILLATTVLLAFFIIKIYKEVIQCRKVLNCVNQQSNVSTITLELKKIGSVTETGADSYDRYDYLIAGRLFIELKHSKTSFHFKDPFDYLDNYTKYVTAAIADTGEKSYFYIIDYSYDRNDI